MASLQFSDEDIAEITRLAGISTSPNVSKWLAGVAGAHEKKEPGVPTASAGSAAASTVAPPPAAAPVSTAKAASSVYFKPITSYGWEESATAVKLYITLAGVELLPQECITANFTANSLTLQVFQLQGTNHSLSLTLADKIVPSGCSFKARNGKVVVTLKKADSKHWGHLTATEKKKADLSELSKPDTASDPSAGLMDMMKKLYEEGDDEMKKTIAKAMSESKKGGAGAF